MRSHHHKLFSEFIRYVIVGGSAFVVDFTALFLLTHFVGLHYLLSASTSFLLGLAFTYALSVLWIFEFRAIDNRKHEFMIFAGIGIAGLALNNLVMYLLTDLAGIHYLVSKIVAAGAILIFNFTSRRTLLFSERTPSACR